MFLGMDPSEVERARMQSEAAVMQVHAFIDSMDIEQLKAFSLIMRAVVNAGEDSASVAGFHWGQASQRLRSEFGMCTCGDDHLKEEHEKLRAERAATVDGRSPEQPREQSSPSMMDELFQQSQMMKEYRVEAVPGTATKVRCANYIDNDTQCGMIWESLDERMLANRCGKCEAGPTGH